MKYQEKTFSVPMTIREPEEERMKREGYEKQPGGWWMKSKIKGLGIKTECPKCGKTDISKIDAAPLYDWNMCRDCYITFVEGNESMLLSMAMKVIVREEFSDDGARSAMDILYCPGMKRWAKQNLSEHEYAGIYEE